MSSKARRAEKKAEWEAQCSAEEEERRRVNSLSLYERLAEAETISDMKAIVEIVCERAGIDIYQ
jgi:hypothetical protein